MATPLVMDTSCLYSTVRNISGGRRKFGFLPPHGRELNHNEEYTIFGNVLEAVVKDVERVTSRRHILAFERAVENADLTIVNTPSPILQDVKTLQSKMFKLQAGQLFLTDACWTSVSGPTD